MAQTSKRHTVEGSSTTARTIVITWIVVACVALVAYWVLPEREPPPSTSTITYTPRPKTDWERPDFADVTFDDDRGERSREGLRGETAKRDRATAKYRIEGTITDSKTEEAVAGANISASYKPSDDEVASFQSEYEVALERLQAGEISTDEVPELKRDRVVDRSGAKGDFFLPVDSPGTYQVSIHRKGYLVLRDVTATITEDEPVAVLTLELSRGASISGRVLEKGGERPAAGLYVTDSPSGHAEKTAADGTYTISGLEPGEHTVTLDLYRHAFSSTAAIPSRTVTIATPDAEIEDIDFVVEAAGEVWGYVLSESGDPMDVDAVLTTSQSILDQVIQVAVKQAPPLADRSSKEDGYYELIGVPLGREFRVHILPRKGEPQLSDPFVLTNSQRSVRIDFSVRAGSTVYGRVVSTTGEVVPEAQIACIPAYSSFFTPLTTAQALRETRADLNGNFVIENLPAGSFQIMGQQRGYKIVTRGESIYPDGMSDIHGVDVLLTPIDVGEHRVFGTVSDPAGRPIADASVSLSGFDVESLSGGEQSTRTDAQGYYELNGVAGGYVMLMVSHGSYQSQIVNEVNFDEPTNVTLRAASAILGRVLVRETGQPPAASNVACRVTALPMFSSEMQGDTLQSLQLLAEGGSDSAWVNDDGTFGLSVPEGTYTLTATARQYSPGTASVTVGEGETTRDVTLYISRAGGRIEGVVIVAGGSDPSGGRVWLSQTNAMPSLDELENMFGQAGGTGLASDGVFQFDALAQGDYTVFAEVPGFAVGRSSPIALGDNQTVTGIQVRVGAGGTLQGFVLQRGTPQPGAIVTIVGGGINRMTTADQNGQYRLESVPEGNYMASAVVIDPERMLESFTPNHARVDIREGQVTTHNFGEFAGATVSGTCTPAPRSGRFGFAVLHMGGAPGIAANLSMADPRSWFTGDSPEGALIVGMAQLQRDGWFEMQNIPPGEFLLDIYHVSIGEALSGNMRLVYSAPVQVTGAEEVQLTINLEEQQ